MNKIIIALLALLFVGSPIAHAQSQFSADWEKNPVIHMVPDKYKNESAVFILDKRLIQYVVENKDYVITRTIHRIIKVYDDKGIESFNKISLPANNDKLISDLRARVILPNGKIIESGRDKIKQSKAEDGHPEYFLAIEGVEKNAEIEILFTERRGFSISGTEDMQFSIPTLTASFSLVVPERFRFETKGYNGFPVASDTSYDKKNYYTATANNIPGMEDEPYANTSANEMRIDYRLSYLPNENPGIRLFTWNDLAKQQYNSYKLEDRDKKIIQKYLQSIGVTDQDNDEQKVRKIEETLKTTINMSEDIDPDAYSRFEVIIDKKVTTEDSYVKFFDACLSVASVPHEIGFTTNRFYYPLDDKFENWKLLDKYIIYLTSLKKYLAPSAIFYRSPFIPLMMANNKAVFCKTTTLGEMTSAIAQIRQVPMPSEEASSINIDAQVTFTKDMATLTNISHSFKGCGAFGLREAFVYVSKDKERDLVENIVGELMSKPEELENYHIDGAAFSNYIDNKPLVVSAEIKSSKLIEKAGPKYLFKVGDIIGRQVQMYQEKERRQPIDIDYPHSLIRTITVTIPDGYKVSNLESIKLSAEHKNAQNQPTMGFNSDYTLQGNVLKISVKEFYYQLHYPVSDIEIFKKVVNAAADFNKVVLILERN